MSLLEDLSKDRRVVLYAVVLALAIILIGTLGLKFGLDLQGGSYLQLQLEGAVTQIDVTPEKILEVQFNASSVEKLGNAYVVMVPGRVKATLPDDLGYSGSKMVEQNNVTKITITAMDTDIITNFLQKRLDADVKIIPDTLPVQYEIRTNVTKGIARRYPGSGGWQSTFGR